MSHSSTLHPPFDFLECQDHRYPRHLTGYKLGNPSPGIYVSGNRSRLNAPHCGIVGSRDIPTELASYLVRLSEKISDAEICVVTGMARGSDSAALAGGARGKAGVLLIPPTGIQRARARLNKSLEERVTFLGIAEPNRPYNTGLALRRNNAIAEMSHVLILAHSGLRSGSLYAVRKVLSMGKQLICLSSDSNTPTGNRKLIDAGLAIPLRISGDVTEASSEVIDLTHLAQKQEPNKGTGLEQLDWLKERTVTDRR